MITQFKFSGHETFHCRHFWLKKGVDHLSAGNSFKNKEAVVELGVGKNMVTSISHWLKAFGLVWEKTFGGGEGMDWAGEAIDLTNDGGSIIAVDDGSFGFLKTSNI